MELIEFRLTPKKVKPWMQDSVDSEFSAYVLEFLRQLPRNGLTLEGGVDIRREGDSYVSRVVAQDSEAIDEKNFSYDTRQALKKLLEVSDGLPVVTSAGKCLIPAHCECRSPGYLILQAPAEWEGSPVMCGDCGKSVPLYRIVPSTAEMEFDDLLGWRRLYRSYMLQHTTGLDGIDYHESYEMLHECVSTLSLAGRRLAGTVERFTGKPTYYPIYNRFEHIPDTCPQCGGDWRNPYPDAIKFTHVCSGCRLVCGARF